MVISSTVEYAEMSNLPEWVKSLRFHFDHGDSVKPEDLRAAFNQTAEALAAKELGE